MIFNKPYTSDDNMEDWFNHRIRMDAIDAARAARAAEEHGRQRARNLETMHQSIEQSAYVHTLTYILREAVVQRLSLRDLEERMARAQHKSLERYREKFIPMMEAAQKRFLSSQQPSPLLLDQDIHLWDEFSRQAEFFAHQKKVELERQMPHLVFKTPSLADPSQAPIRERKWNRIRPMTSSAIILSDEAWPTQKSQTQGESQASLIAHAETVDFYVSVCAMFHGLSLTLIEDLASLQRADPKPLQHLWKERCQPLRQRVFEGGMSEDEQWLFEEYTKRAKNRVKLIKQADIQRRMIDQRTPAPGTLFPTQPQPPKP